VIAKRVPGQLADQAMVLVRVVPVLGEDQVGLHLLQLFFENGLDLRAFKGEETVFEIFYDQFFLLGLFCEQIETLTGFMLAFAATVGEDHPGKFEIGIFRKPLQDGTAAADLDVIGVTADAEDLERIAVLQ